MASNQTRGAAVTYLLQGERGGPIKIGLSNTEGLGARVNALQTGYPYRLKLVRVIDGNLEATLHEQFAHLRMCGEWFAPGKELLDFAGAEAIPGEHSDFRAGFEAGYAAATTELQVQMHRAFEYVDDPRTLSRAMEEAAESSRSTS